MQPLQSLTGMLRVLRIWFRRLKGTIMHNAGASAAAGAGAYMIQAVRASGAIVVVEPENFRAIVEKAETPLVVCSEGHFIIDSYQYLTPYKGLVFYAKSRTPLVFPGRTELVKCRKIWVPG